VIKKMKKILIVLICLSIMSTAAFNVAMAVSRTNVGNLGIRPPEYIYLYPDSEGDVQQWDPYPTNEPVSRCSHWDKVDDIEPDMDETYVWTTEAGSIEDFNHRDIDLPPGVSISNVKIVAGVRATEPGVNLINVGIRVNGVRLSGSYHLCGEMYAGVPSDFPRNPFTGEPWTVLEVNALQSSLEYTYGFSEVRCTQVFIIVTCD
jgi:hypothetical protein